MPKILASKLDKARAEFDKSAKELVAQMRKKAQKVIHGHALEDLVKFMPDAFEDWVKAHPDFTRGDFTNSRWGELATLEWHEPTNKALAMVRSYEVLRATEKEMLKSWQ